MNKQLEKRPLLVDLLPEFAVELQQLLVEQGEPDLAAQVPTLAIHDRCRCKDDICCGTFYTRAKPEGAYGRGHRNVALTPDEGMLILDIVDGKIVCVEIIDNPLVRRQLDAALH